MSLRNIVSDTLKHYVWPPQTHCLTISNMLFDNFNIYVLCTKGVCFDIRNLLSDNYRCTRILGVFCPSDFRNDFRGHSRDSKRPENWLVFYVGRITFFYYRLQYVSFVEYKSGWNPSEKFSLILRIMEYFSRSAMLSNPIRSWIFESACSEYRN